MRSKLAAAVAVSLLALAGAAAAQGFASPAEAKQHIERALALVVQGQVQPGFALLEPHWPLPKSEFDTLVMQTVQQRGLIGTRIGKSLGLAVVSEATVADTLHRIVLLERFENHCLRWSFVFYKAETTWRINSVSWDDKVLELFE